MGEVQYVWADPSSPQQQVALSSIVQAMYEKGVLAIARWVTKDGMDPKMGVLSPTIFDKVDCLLWAQASSLCGDHTERLTSNRFTRCLSQMMCASIRSHLLTA